MAASPATVNRKPPLIRVALAWSAVGLLALMLKLGPRPSWPELRGLRVSADIVRQSQELDRQIKANQALEQEIAFLKTDAGKQWAVYRYLGMVAPGQEAGRLIETPQAAPKLLTGPQRVRAWVDYKQRNATSALQELGQVLSCYAGTRPLDQSPNRRNPQDSGLSKQKDKKVEPETDAATKPITLANSVVEDKANVSDADRLQVSGSR